MFPKQFLSLVGERTMLQETLGRVTGGTFTPPLCIANEEHRFIIAEQFRAIGQTPAAIMLEPVGRNTAPAVCVAALSVAADDASGLILVLPADQVIRDMAAFERAIAAAIPAAAAGALVTFGIQPSYPETGYGYILAGAPLRSDGEVAKVDRFVEKPDLERAKAYVADSRYLWNSGIFLFNVGTLLEEMRTLCPEVVECAAAALAGAKRDNDFCRLDKDAFIACPSLSVDHAVMEHTEKAAVVPVSMGWSDVGAWPALWALSDKDDNGNAVRGKVELHDARNCLVRSEDGPLAAVIGVDDLVVVVADDAVLVTSQSRAQDVKVVVDRLKAQNRREHQYHSTVYRPWGSFRGVDSGARFQVKQLTVNPGAKLSLQMHHHRAEHWIVVEGTARVTRGDEIFLLHENQSTYIPLGVVHRLENPGLLPLRVIEVQSGGYLGEDDIVRLEDVFGRDIG